jgi:hypothetical protein
MATSSPEPPTMPRIEIPVVDPTTGKMTVAWYKWFLAWEKIWRTIRTEIP